MIVHSDYVRESRLDQAISRGFDPHEPDDLVARPLDGAWLTAFDASVAEAQALTAGKAASAHDDRRASAQSAVNAIRSLVDPMSGRIDNWSNR